MQHFHGGRCTLPGGTQSAVPCLAELLFLVLSLLSSRLGTRGTDDGNLPERRLAGFASGAADGGPGLCYLSGACVALRIGLLGLLDVYCDDPGDAGGVDPGDTAMLQWTA